MSLSVTTSQAEFQICLLHTPILKWYIWVCCFQTCVTFFCWTYMNVELIGPLVSRSGMLFCCMYRYRSGRFCGFQRCMTLFFCTSWLKWQGFVVSRTVWLDFILWHILRLKWWGFVVSRAVWHFFLAGHTDIEVTRFCSFQNCDIILWHILMLKWQGLYF